MAHRWMSSKLLLLLLLLPLLSAAKDEQLQLVGSYLYPETIYHECHVTARGWQLKVGNSTDSMMQLNLDPLMCITGTLAEIQSSYDPIEKMAYVSIPVTLTESKVPKFVTLALRNELERITKVEFADVTEVTVDTDPGAEFTKVAFVWSQGEPTGFLRIGCDSAGQLECKIENLVSSLRAGRFSSLDPVLLHAKLRLSSAPHPQEVVAADFRLTFSKKLRSHQWLDLSLSWRGFDRHLPDCPAALGPPQLVPLHGNCSCLAHRVHGRWLLESPICFSELQESGSSPDSQELRLRLTVRTPTDSELGEAAKKLGWHPASLVAPPLLGARRSVSRLLQGRFSVGQLTVTAGDSEGEVTVRCGHHTSCRFLRSQISANPVNFWRHIAWQPTYLVAMATGHCLLAPSSPRFAVRMTDAGRADGAAGAAPVVVWTEACGRRGPSAHCRYQVLPDGRHFVVIQQRTLGTALFNRTWTEYEAGFGDSNDFWIGLTALHALTTGHSRGVNLRLELTQWNGSQLVAEYSGFRVDNANTSYRMTYNEMANDRSNVEFDAMRTSKGMKFSTMDRDNDLDDGSCSMTWGRGGWWFNKCYKFYPNGLFPTTVLKDWRYNIWATDTEVVPLKIVRILVQV